MSDAPELLACPRCRGAVAEAERGLRCDACGLSFPVVAEVARMLDPDQALPAAARTFGAQWRLRARGGFERDTLYGFTRGEHLARALRGLRLGREELDGKRVLDVGCGTGLLAGELARLGARVVAVDVAAELGGDLPRPLPAGVTLVQGDVLRLPARGGAFDVVWCAGVIHTTADPRRGFEELARTLAPGGRLYAWVDNERSNPVQRLRERLPSLPPALLLGLAFLLAGPAALAVNLSRSTRYRRPMGLRTAAFAIHDHLASPHQFHHGLAELSAWCAAAGLEPPLDVSEDEGGLAILTRAPGRSRASDA